VARGVLRKAGIGREATLTPLVRGDNFCWVEPGEAGVGIQALMDRLEAMRLVLNRTAYLGLARFEMQLACYEAESPGYSRHFDAFQGAGPERRLTIIYYLNPDWIADHGGCLGLYLPAGQVDIDPLHDRLLVFLAGQVEHAVLPVHSPRLALTAWFYGP